jgi:hypothetical protein
MKHKLSGDGETREVYLDGKFLDPEPSKKIRNHSPDNFNWGYGGSGPSQLALAVVLKLTGKEDGYQDFKFRVIAGLQMGKDFDIEFEL